MKNLIIILALMFSFSINAQSMQMAGLTSILEKSVEKLVYKVKKDTTIEKIGVYYFRNADRSVSPLGIYLAEEYSTQLAMHPDAPQLVARTSIEAVVDEKTTKLTANDEYSATIKLGKLNVADAVVSGTITKIGNEYNVDIKLYNSANGNIIAADRFTINGKEYDEMYGAGVVIAGSKPKDCETKNTCTICFVNNLIQPPGSTTINVMLRERNGDWSNSQNMTVSYGEKKCFYRQDASKVYEYMTADVARHISQGQFENLGNLQGQVVSEPCKEEQIIFK